MNSILPPASRFGIDDGSQFPRASRRMRIAIVGGGRIAKVQAMAMRLSNRWDLVAGALSSRPKEAKERAAEWYISVDRSYGSYAEMAKAESTRPDGIDAVAITTPNDSHYEIAKTFLAAGIDVICDKPLTTDLSEAIDLVHRTRQAGLVFGITYAYAAYPMVRQARAMIAAGEIGLLRQVHVEYVQEYMTGGGALDMKHIQWRQDPIKSGATACTADIGTHAHHLATFVSGMEMTKLRAELLVCGTAKKLDDTVYVNARYDDDVPGLLWATQVAPGNFVGLRFRIFGEKGGLQWDQENPDYLYASYVGKPTQIVRRGFGGVDPAAERLTRIARGNTEGWIEAWANLFTEFAVAIAARREGRSLPAGLVQFPTVEDGARGMKFVDAVLESHRKDGAWVDSSLSL